PLRSTEQPPAAGKRLQRILRSKERMVLAQARALALDVAGVLGIELGDRRPVGREVSLDTVAPLELAVGLHSLFEQRRVVPRRAVIGRRRAGRRGHRPEFAVELLTVDVLRLVDLHEQPRRMADDIRRWLRRKEYLPPPAKTDRAPVLAFGY